jgi:hypothetical protein
MWGLICDYMERKFCSFWKEVREPMFFTVGILTLTMILIHFMAGCTASQRQMFKDGAVTAADCSLHSSLGCATQSLAACALPSFDGGDWGDYAKCVSDSSIRCQSTALARCMMLGISRAVDGGPVIAGGVGCSHLKDKIDLCVKDLDCETEAECVQGVAYCYQTICTRGE